MHAIGAHTFRASGFTVSETRRPVRPGPASSATRCHLLPGKVEYVVVLVEATGVAADGAFHFRHDLCARQHALPSTVVTYATPLSNHEHLNATTVEPCPQLYHVA